MEALKQRVLGDRYELGPAIGSGGFGTVFRARDRRSGADVAVKLVLPGLGSEAAAQRLRREGAILRKVASRHVAKVYDSGDDENGVWLVTELVDGAPLTTATLGRALLPHEVLRVARALLDGLAAVHDTGIIHGDVKPTNVLAPRGEKGLDGVKIVDFGLARMVARSEVAASIGEPMMRQGTVLGTARYMAPEVLAGGDPVPGSDLYSAGLLLFELLDAGPLFPQGDARAQLRARVAGEAQLGERVPEPLSDVLSRMLAREPAARYRDAREAHAAVVDLDTAPVSIVRDEGLVPRVATVPPAASARSTLPPLGPTRSNPPAARTTVAPPTSAKSFAPPPPSAPPLPPPPRAYAVPPPPGGRAIPPVERAPESSRSLVPTRPPDRPSSRMRMSSLPATGVIALRETLAHLDLPMLDALARRERGNVIGRISRGVALALRLELDAAALILEPLAMQSDVARAMGICVLAPRARRVTRARVDSDREDRWVDTIDAELAAMLVSLAAALSASDEGTRGGDRFTRALARLATLASSPSLDATRTTLELVIAAARARRGELDRAAAWSIVAPLVAEGRTETAFHVVVRGLALAALAGDEPRVRVLLERAEVVAAETGTTLLDACAATALGALRASGQQRDERALGALERASTLLAHGDAPSLEHEAEHHRATVLLSLGRWSEAITHLRGAREAAHAEHAGERELFSTSLEVVAALATRDRGRAYETAAVLGDARLASAKGRTAGLAWVARALAALSANDPEGAEDALTQAEMRSKEAGRESADVSVVVEILGMLFDAARGALRDLEGSASSLERIVAENSFEAFYWLDLLAAVVGGLEDVEAGEKMADALRRIRPILSAQN